MKNAVAGSNATSDVDPKDNEAPFSVFTDANPAKLSISAAPVSGHVGDTVRVNLTVRNTGTGDSRRTKVKLTAPAGTQFGALGLGIAAVGGVLMVLARRRRAVVSPPTD